MSINSKIKVLIVFNNILAKMYFYALYVRTK